MEEYEKTDKTWWQATDFMYKHLLSTGQSWSHVQKLEFVQNLSGLLKGVERNTKTQQKIRIDVTKVARLVDELVCAAQGTVWDGGVENNQRLIEAKKNIIETVMQREYEFDKHEVFALIVRLRDEAHRQGMRSQSNAYEDCVVERQNELLAALDMDI